MTAPFDPRELRRLSDAATLGPWKANEWYGTEDGGWCAVGPHHEYDKDEGDEPDSTTHERAKLDAALIAYLGTHREAILRMLEAADALAEAGRKLRDGVESIAMYGEESAYSPRELVDEYDAATKGTT